MFFWYFLFLLFILLCCSFIGFSFFYNLFFSLFSFLSYFLRSYWPRFLFLYLTLSFFVFSSSLSEKTSPPQFSLSFSVLFSSLFTSSTQLLVRFPPSPPFRPCLFVFFCSFYVFHLHYWFDFLNFLCCPGFRPYLRHHLDLIGDLQPSENVPGTSNSYTWACAPSLF